MYQSEPEELANKDSFSKKLMVETLTRVPVNELLERQTAAYTELASMLYDALGFQPEELPNSLPQESLESAEGIVLYGKEVAERVANHWSNLGYKPNPDVLVNGLVEFAVQAGSAVKTAMPKIDPAEVEERMKELGIRIRGVVIDSEGRIRNLRTDRDIFTTHYMQALQQM